jgi:hypothetical protein
MNKAVFAYLLMALLCILPTFLCTLLGMVLNRPGKNKTGNSYDPGSINTNTEKEIMNDE